MPQQLPFWITVPRVPVTKEELVKYAGEKCPDYEQHCACCEAWEQWEKFGTIDCLIDRKELLGEVKC